MYISLLNRYYGQDNIVSYTPPHDLTCNAGDVMIVGGEYGIVLGESVARGCDYVLDDASSHQAESLLLSPTSMMMVHWMVHEWYSSYRKVLPLWLGNDITNLLKRKPQTPPSPSPAGSHLVRSGTSRIRDDKKHHGQQCMIFPDLRTIYSMIDERIRTDNAVVILSSAMTEKQRNDARWAIKYGKKRIILSTPAAFFHDRYRLTDIQVVDSHLRYYKNRQNPRYNVSAVVAQRKAHLSTTSHSMQTEQ